MNKNYLFNIFYVVIAGWLCSSWMGFAMNPDLILLMNGTQVRATPKSVYVNKYQWNVNAPDIFLDTHEQAYNARALTGVIIPGVTAIANAIYAYTTSSKNLESYKALVETIKKVKLDFDSDLASHRYAVSNPQPNLTLEKSWQNVLTAVNNAIKSVGPAGTKEIDITLEPPKQQAPAAPVYTDLYVEILLQLKKDCDSSHINSSKFSSELGDLYKKFINETNEKIKDLENNDDLKQQLKILNNLYLNY